MDQTSGILAIGPWQAEHVECSWSAQQYEPSESHTARADAALKKLQDRGSPSHDGAAGRLVDFSAEGAQLAIQMQPARWALRLVEGDASSCMASLCVVRSASGEWLAGKRADWVASWPNRWGLGAGGAVEVDESPFETLGRELEEEWSVTPERIRGEALLRTPNGLAMFVGQAWLPDGAEPVADAEHSEFAWLPSDVQRWPDYADEPLRNLATLLAAREEL